MNAAHVHLLLNHVAILGAIFSFIVFAWGTIRKDKSIRMVALGGFVFSALAAIPVFLTGEPAEEIVENLGGVSKSMIEEHEEAATVALWLTEILGAVSLIVLLAEVYQWKFASRLHVPLLVLGLAASCSIAYSGYIGGKIHHTEINSASTNNSGTENAGSSEEEKD